MTTDTKSDGAGSLRDRAYETIRRRIIEVELPPGQRLIERDLAAELNVSRIPLREALRLLSAEGLVVIVPGRGTIVSPFTPSDVSDLFDVRSSLEATAIKLATERADDTDLMRLHDILTVARDCHDDPHRLTDLNVDFHSEIVRASGNKLLTTLMRPLDSRLRWLFHLAIDMDPVTQCAHHEAIYDALHRRDAQQAQRLLLDHIESGRAPIIEMAARWNVDDIDPQQATRTRRRTAKDA